LAAYRLLIEDCRLRIEAPKTGDIEKRLHDAARDGLERHKALRELLRLSGADPEIPFAPARMRTEMTAEPRCVRFVFPIPGYGPGDVALMIAGAAGVLAVKAVLRWRGYAGALPEGWWLACAVILAIALGFRAWVLATRRTAVTMSREGLEWIRQGPLGRRVETFNRGDIGRMVLPRPPSDPVRGEPPTLMRFPLRPLRDRPGIVVRSGARSVEFGRNLSYIELRWIHTVARRILGVKDE